MLDIIDNRFATGRDFNVMNPDIKGIEKLFV